MLVKQCYKSDGTNSTDAPCDPYAATSTCCGSDSNSVCDTNLACIYEGWSMVPGSCTDQYWGSVYNPACPCSGSDNDQGVGNYLNAVTLCGDGSFCCGSANIDCCVQRNGSPIIEFGNTATIPSATSLRSIYYAGLHVSTLAISVASTTATPASSSSSSSATSGASVTSVKASSVFVTVTAKPSAASGLSSGAKIGLGVGVGLGGLIIILLIGVMVIWFKGRPRREEDQGWRESKVVSPVMGSGHPEGHQPSAQELHEAQYGTYRQDQHEGPEVLHEIGYGRRE